MDNRDTKITERLPLRAQEIVKWYSEQDPVGYPMLSELFFSLLSELSLFLEDDYLRGARPGDHSTFLPHEQREIGMMIYSRRTGNQRNGESNPSR